MFSLCSDKVTFTALEELPGEDERPEDLQKVDKTWIAGGGFGSISLGLNGSLKSAAIEVSLLVAIFLAIKRGVVSYRRGREVTNKPKII